MSRLEIILSAILFVSIVFNVGIFVYARAAIARLLSVSEELGDLHYLELCDDGITPKHPLGNLSKDLVPLEYKLNTIIDG